MATDPNSVHEHANSYGDHTSGDGLMMVVNGAKYRSGGQPVVWAQRVRVRPGTTYRFEMWVSSWTSGSPALIRVTMNGRPLATMRASSEVARWDALRADWRSEQNESVTIAIYDDEQDTGGNDFAIDDISLRAR